MTATYSDNNDLHNIKYRSDVLQRPVTQPLYHNVQNRHTSRRCVQNEPLYSSAPASPNQLPFSSYSTSEHLQLPRYVIPILYSPKGIMMGDELSRNQPLNKLFHRKSYEKICQGVPVTSLDEHRVILNKKCDQNLTQSASLSRSETEVYSKLMKNMYGVKDVKADSRGDYTCCNDQQDRVEYARQPVTQRINKMYLEPDRDYSNPNFQSDSDISLQSDSDISLTCDASNNKRSVQPTQTSEEYKNNVLDNSPNKIAVPLFNASSLVALKDESYYQTVGYSNYGNRIKRYANYGTYPTQTKTLYAEACPSCNKYSEIKTKSPTVPEAVKPQNDYQEVERISETRATQTLLEKNTDSVSQETQTSCRKISRKRSSSKMKKSANKNVRSEANITVIIDRGWKEDVYSIAGGPVRSDSSVTKSESTPAVDLLPIIPCLQLKNQDVTSTSPPSSKRPTRNSAINTNISLCKNKLKSKPVAQ